MRRAYAISLVGLLGCTGVGPSPAPAPATAAPRGTGEVPELSRALAERYAGLALACVHRPYPNKIAHVLESDADAKPPRELTPAFYGCFDWHSAVHGHWLLARVAHRFPRTELAARAKAALGESLTAEHLAAEVAYVGREDRTGFERPYGLAWLLQLGAELRQWDDPQARAWARALAPLEQVAADRLRTWIAKLTHPIRIGEHAQTAFGFGLALDWARVAGDDDLAAIVQSHSRRLYGDDHDCPLHMEPSGHDFLSPCLGEADLMRRILPPAEFARWLSRLLPGVPTDGDGAWLRPAVVSDRSDGKLVHLDGLNLSRAWMLEGIATGLPDDDPRRAALRACAAEHARVGLDAVSGDDYAGGHWLGTFAVYLTSGRGI